MENKRRILTGMLIIWLALCAACSPDTESNNDSDSRAWDRDSRYTTVPAMIADLPAGTAPETGDAGYALFDGNPETFYSAEAGRTLRYTFTREEALTGLSVYGAKGMLRFYATEEDMAAGTALAEMDGPGEDAWMDLPVTLTATSVFLTLAPGAGAGEIAFTAVTNGRYHDGAGAADAGRFADGAMLEASLAAGRADALRLTPVRREGGAAVFTLPVDPVVYRRALIRFAVTGASQAQCGVALNGVHVYAAAVWPDARSAGRGDYSEELPAAALMRGENRIAIRVPEGAVLDEESVVLVLAGENGWGAVRETAAGTRSVSEELPPVTLAAESGGAVATLDALARVHECAVWLDAEPSTVVTFEYDAGDGWKTASGGITAGGKGWAVYTPDEPVPARRVRVGGGNTDGTIRVGGVKLFTSPLENPASGNEIVVSYPRNGEYCGDAAQIRGYVRGSGGVSRACAAIRDVTLDAHGLYSVNVSRTEAGYGDAPGEWSVLMKAERRTRTVSAYAVNLQRDLSAKTQTGGTTGGATGGGSDIEESADAYSFTLKPDSARAVTYRDVAISFPAGAVDADTKITIIPLTPDQVSGLNAGMSNVTWPDAGYRFLINGKPHGSFKKPITITMAYSAALLSPGQTEADVNMYYYSDDEQRWVKTARAETGGAGVNVQASRAVGAKTEISAVTDHFTDYINATITVPDHPETNSFNPNTIKDIKAADPSANMALIEPPALNASGDASVSYPLTIPGGRAGMQPRLAITYNSSASDTWCGEGWDIENSMVSLDTRWGVPGYDETPAPDTYVLDGETLVPDYAASTDGVRVYRPRREGAFRRIVRIGPIADCRFEVTDKSGTKYYYGTDAASRLDDGAKKICQWRLARVTDLHGNTMTYHYTRRNEGARSITLSRINYTGYGTSEGKYDVLFASSAKDRPRTSARTGFLTTADMRLNTITVRYDGVPVWRYELSYRKGSFSRDLLQSIRQYNRNNELFTEHTLEYDGAQYCVEGSGTTPELVNADRSWGGKKIGKMEQESVGVSSYIGWSPFNTLKFISLGGGGGCSNGSSTTISTLMDIDGDGLPDMVFRDESNIKYRKNISVPGGELGFSDKEYTVGRLSGSDMPGERTYERYWRLEAMSVGYTKSRSENTANTYFSDVNGDGLPDLVKNGAIHFNTIGADGIPSFTSNVNEVPVTFNPGEALEIEPDNNASGESADDLRKIFYRDNPLRIWRASQAGKITIRSTLQRVGTRPTADYATYDGMRATIWQCRFSRSGKPLTARLLWSRVIPVNELDAIDSVLGEDGSIEVSPVSAEDDETGDLIVFMLDSGDDGANDVAAWRSEISYHGSTPRYDENGLSLTRYDSKDDFSAGGSMGFMQINPSESVQNIRLRVRKLREISDDVYVECYLRKIVTTVNRNAAGDLFSDGEVVSYIPLAGTWGERVTVGMDDPVNQEYVQNYTVSIPPTPAVDKEIYPMEVTSYYLDSRAYATSPVDYRAFAIQGEVIRADEEKPALFVPNIRNMVPLNAGAVSIPRVINYRVANNDGDEGEIQIPQRFNGYFIIQRKTVPSHNTNDDDRILVSIPEHYRGNIHVTLKARPKGSNAVARKILTRTIRIFGSADGVGSIESDMAHETAASDVSLAAAQLDYLTGLMATSAASCLGYESLKVMSYAFKRENFLQENQVRFDLFSNLGAADLLDADANEYYISAAYETLSDGVAVANAATKKPVMPYDYYESGTLEIYSADVEIYDVVPNPVAGGLATMNKPRAVLTAHADEYTVAAEGDLLSGGVRNWYYGRLNGDNHDAGTANEDELQGWSVIDPSYIFGPEKGQQQHQEERDYYGTVIRNYSVMGGSRRTYLGNGAFQTETSPTVDAFDIWKGHSGDTWISAEHMSATRMIEKYVPELANNAPAAATRIALNRACARFTRTISSNTSLSLVSQTKGDSETTSEFMDINGDRYPDIVKSGKAYVSRADGSLCPIPIDVHGLPRKASSINQSLSVTYPETAIMVMNTARGDPLGIKSADNATSGGGAFGTAGIGGGKGENYTGQEYLDVNGDGLPEKVTSSFTTDAMEYTMDVYQNYGTGFASSERSLSMGGSRGLTKTESLSWNISAGAVGMTQGFSSEGAAYSGGVGASETNAASRNLMLDMNGDGLADLVYGAGDKIRVRFNTGQGFEEQAWTYGGGNETFSRESTQVLNIMGNATYKILVSILGVPIGTVQITMGANASRTENYTEKTITDMNGDGYPDIVYYHEGEVKVLLNNTGKVNLLKKINRPLNGSITIAYERKGNTQDMPESKWVMKSVTVADGTPVNTEGRDAHGSVRRYTTTYEYDKPKYDRNQREQYGFGMVTEHRPDGTSVTHEYLNSNYHEKGLEKKTTVRQGDTILSETENQYERIEITKNENNPDTAWGEENTTYNERNELKLGYRMTSKWMRLESTITRDYDGGTMIRSEGFTYDTRGNVKEYREYDGLPTGTPRVKAAIVYTQNPDKHVYGMPKMMAVLGGDGTVYRERHAAYDGNMRLKQVKEISGATESVTDLDYDQYGNLTGVTGPANGRGQRRSLRYTYDTTVNTYVEKVTDAAYDLESRTQYDYRYGVPFFTTDSNGYALRYSYDANARMIYVYGPETEYPILQMVYEPQSNPPKALTINYSDGQQTDNIRTETYIDGLKRVQSVKKSGSVEGKSVMISSGAVRYDEAGRTVEQGEPYETPWGSGYEWKMENATEIEYDARGRKTTVTNPDGTEIRYTYTISGGQYRTTITDPEGKQKTSWTDARGNITRVEEPGGIVTTYTYDAMNQIRTVTDAKGNITTCKYDKQGRRIETDNPDTGKITYTYDGAGNLISKTTPNLDAKGSAINYQYDCTRLIAVTYRDQNAVRYTYGRKNSLGASAGRLIQVSNGDVTDDYQYDWMGNITKNERTITTLRTKTTKKYTTMYRYDYLGRMQEMKLPDGERITYGYDRGGQLLGVGSSKNKAYVTKILYNATGQRTSITYANGITTKYEYHPKNHRLETLTTSGEDGTLQQIEYEYDKVGNVTERESSYTGTDGKKKTVTHSYTYDDNDRLTKAQGGIEKQAGLLRPDIVTYKSSYTYDAIGNILNKTQSVNGQASATLTHNNDYKYTIDKPHAVTKAGNMLYTYDANGNMLTRENTKTKAKMTLVWDNENRLKQSIDTQYTTDYRYDANGERILKSSDMGELEYVSASYVVRNGTIVSKHIFAGNGRVASTVGNLTDEGKTTTNSVLYYHPDHLGSSSYVTDKQGRFYEAIEYLPYGETLYNERTESDGVSYKYTGLEKDLETGFYAMTHRYYDASLGKFLSVDPILEMYLEGEGNGGVYYSINLDLYSYASCNPINFSDPSGLLSGKDLDSASMGSWRGFEIDDTGGSKAPSSKVRKESQVTTNRGSGAHDYYLGKGPTIRGSLGESSSSIANYDALFNNFEQNWKLQESRFHRITAGGGLFYGVSYSSQMYKNIYGDILSVSFESIQKGPFVNLGFGGTTYIERIKEVSSLKALFQKRSKGIGIMFILLSGEDNRYQNDWDSNGVTVGYAGVISFGAYQHQTYVHEITTVIQGKRNVIYREQVVGD